MDKAAFGKQEGAYLLICKSIPSVSKQVACHNGAAVSDAALIQLCQLQRWCWWRLKGALIFSARQEGLQQGMTCEDADILMTQLTCRGGAATEQVRG